MPINVGDKVKMSSCDRNYATREIVRFDVIGKDEKKVFIDGEEVYEFECVSKKKIKYTEE